MTDSDESITHATAARNLIRSQDTGILSTQSEELQGYPFGSVTPYVMAHTGQVAVYVSAIAEHTANMRANPKACLTVVQNGDGNSQARGRVTFVGDAVPVPEASLAEVEERYFSLFPEARHYGQAHPFEFFWIEPKRIRYIAGFGMIHWVEPAEWSLPSPEWSGGEFGIVQHMNKDHGDSVRAIVERQGAVTDDETLMVAVDIEGCHIRTGGQHIYVPFANLVASEQDLRMAMIELARGS